MEKEKLTEKKKEIYLIDDKIKWKPFKAIWDAFPHGTIVPKEMIKGKLIWGMVRDKELFVYIDEKEKDDPVVFAIKLPRNRPILLLTNPKNNK